MLDSQYNNDYDENNFKIDVEKRERKYSWSTVFAWLYLNTIGKILPKKWNKWAENILNPYEVTIKSSSSGFTGLEEDNQSQMAEEEFNLQPNETTEEEKKILANCIESQEQKIEELTKNLENSEKEMVEFNSKFDGLFQELARVRGELERKNIDLESLEKAAGEKAQDYGKRVQNLLDEISAFNRKVAEMETTITAREEKIHELEKANSEKKELQHKLISEHKKVNLLQNKLAALRKENKELEQSLDETKRQQEGYKKQLEDAVRNPQNGQASEKNELQKQLEARIIELENELNAKAKSSQELLEQLKRYEEQLDKLNKFNQQLQQKPDIIPSSTKTQSNQPKNSRSAIDISTLNNCFNSGTCHRDFFEGEKLHASLRSGFFPRFSKFLSQYSRNIKCEANKIFGTTKKSTILSLLNTNSKNSVFSGKSIFHNVVDRTIKCLLHRNSSVFTTSQLITIFTYNIHELIKNEILTFITEYNKGNISDEMHSKLIEEVNLFLSSPKVKGLVSEVVKEFLKEMCNVELETGEYELKKEVVEKCQSPNPKIDSPKIGRILRSISTQSTP